MNPPAIAFALSMSCDLCVARLMPEPKLVFYSFPAVSRRNKVLTHMQVLVQAIYLAWLDIDIRCCLLPTAC